LPQKSRLFLSEVCKLAVNNLFRCNKSSEGEQSRMKKKIYLIILLITTISSLTPAEEPVYFADTNLKMVAEEALGIIDPTPSDMLLLTFLDADRKGIRTSKSPIYLH
jgi:hypothetical protein